MTATTTTSTATGTALRFVDADGHVLEHPTGMVEHAPASWRERIWHIETDGDGEEWIVMDGHRSHANVFALAGAAGMSDEERSLALEGKLRYTEVCPAAFNAGPRLADMSTDGIDVSVLYPTMMLWIAGYPGVEFAEMQSRAYNDWLDDHVRQGAGRLFGVAVIPQQDPERAAAEIRRVADLPGIVGAFIRPNPTSGKQLNDERYDPIWRAASDTGLALGLHPALSSDLPGACEGLRLDQLGLDTPLGRGEIKPQPGLLGTKGAFDNMFFTQAIANPVDMMTAMTFLIGGGVCERFPDLRLVFLEANGGWVVPWLERLDHHAKEFFWDVPWLKMKPSEYFRRQCWISFDPDESTLAFTATSPLCGADRIIWASDFPHPDAKFPGTTAELTEAIESLSLADQRRIAGENAVELYDLSLPDKP
ncbi:MAG: amidohydrolase family protein [Acidimicrobiales bacterium]